MGSQTPTHRWVPPYEYSRGDEVIELAEMTGLQLDPYQRELLIDGCGCVMGEPRLEGETGLVERWSAFEVALELARQNGKSVIFEARVLAGLYLFRERLIVYSAHKGETAMEAFGRIEALIRSDPELLAEVKPNGFKRTNGKESIELYTGQRVKFRTRTKGGGRGLAGDCVIIDEAQDAQDDELAALFPLLSARPNAQLWYGGSAGGKEAVVLGRLIRRGDRKEDRLCVHRFASDEDVDLDDPKAYARVNPALGRRMTLETIESERNAMSLESFSRERMTIGDYPRPEGEDWVIPRPRFEKAEDPGSVMVKGAGLVIAPEIKWDRTGGSISVAGYRADGRRHFETVMTEKGTAWIPDEIKRLTVDHADLGVLAVVLDPGSPAATLIGPLKDRGILEAKFNTKTKVWEIPVGTPGATNATMLVPLGSTDLTRGFGDFYDALMHMEILTVDGVTLEQPDPRYRHGGGTVLYSALAEAVTRQLGGSQTWRRMSTSDVTPILSATWALQGLTMLGQPRAPGAPPRRGRKRAPSRDSLASVGF